MYFYFCKRIILAPFDYWCFTIVNFMLVEREIILRSHLRLHIVFLRFLIKKLMIVKLTLNFWTVVIFIIWLVHDEFNLLFQSNFNFDLILVFWFILLCLKWIIIIYWLLFLPYMWAILYRVLANFRILFRTASFHNIRLVWLVRQILKLFKSLLISIIFYFTTERTFEILFFVVFVIVFLLVKDNWST